MGTICLIDLSGVFRAAWHASEQDDVGHAYTATLSAVQSYLGAYDHIGICIDSPPYRRKEIDPNYKAHREKAPDVMHEQHRKVIERLEQDGHHIFGAKGYEADDIIATIVEWAESQGHKTTIYSADKDLMQLVSPNTCCISTSTRQKYEVDDVMAKFGVHPELIPDLLALWGDRSDNIQGVKGCGTKTAAKWLASFENLEGIISNAKELGKFGPIVEESADLLRRSKKLTTLEVDAPIKPEEILQPMKPKEKEPVRQYEFVEPEIVEAGGGQEIPQPEASCVVASGVADKLQEAPPTATQLVRSGPFELALEPRDIGQAWKCAHMMFESRMFKFANAESVMAVIMTGRTFGMDVVSSLRNFQIVQGQVSPKAQLLVGLCQRHPKCKYFRFVGGDDKSATWETHRDGDPEPTRMTFTMQDAALLGLAGKDNWKKQPKTMLRWRAAANLARTVYSDIVSGLYCMEELYDEVG